MPAYDKYLNSQPQNTGKSYEKYLQQTEQYSPEEALNEQGVSEGERGLINNLQDNPELIQKWLIKKGYDAKVNSKGDVVMRKAPNEPYKKIEHEGDWYNPLSWELKDFTSDAANEYASLGGMAKGAAMGAAPGSLLSPIGSVAGGIVGAGAGAAAVEAARRLAAKGAGFEETLPGAAKSVLEEGLYGMAGEGIGKGVGMVVGKGIRVGKNYLVKSAEKEVEKKMAPLLKEAESKASKAREEFKPIEEQTTQKLEELNNAREMEKAMETNIKRNKEVIDEYSKSGALDMELLANDTLQESIDGLSKAKIEREALEAEIKSINRVPLEAAGPTLLKQQQTLLKQKATQPGALLGRKIEQVGQLMELPERGAVKAEEKIAGWVNQPKTAAAKLTTPELTPAGIKEAEQKTATALQAIVNRLEVNYPGAEEFRSAIDATINKMPQIFRSRAEMNDASAFVAKSMNDSIKKIPEGPARDKMAETFKNIIKEKFSPIKEGGGVGGMFANAMLRSAGHRVIGPVATGALLGFSGIAGPGGVVGAVGGAMAAKVPGIIGRKLQTMGQRLINNPELLTQQIAKRKGQVPNSVRVLASAINRLTKAKGADKKLVDKKIVMMLQLAIKNNPDAKDFMDNLLN